MAKEKPEEKGKHEGGGEKKKPAKKHLHQIVTTFAHDGTASHEHVYKDKKEDHHTHPPVFAGTSAHMDDLHQHMDDHAGQVMNGGAGSGEPAAEAVKPEGEGEGGEGGGGEY